MSVPELIKLDFAVDEGFGSRARLGLILLESDQTLEVEARRIDIPGVDFYHARIENEMEVNPATLTAMLDRLPATASLLAGDLGFDAIGYGCTSASTLIGPDAVTTAIQSVHRAMTCTNPISAAVAAFGALDAKRIAVVTPYTADVTGPVIEHLVSAGLHVTAFGSFLESSDLVVGRITHESIAAGVRSVLAEGACDAVFVSCTSLRLIERAAELEDEVSLPVVSSNMALLWHLLRLVGVDDQLPELGTLFTRPLAN